MHWYDHVATLCALILALWADYDAGLSLRASIVTFLRVDGGWVRTYDLREVFGPSVYKHLHRLADREIVERKVEPGNPHLRSGRPDYWYRWRATAK